LVDDVLENDVDVADDADNSAFLFSGSFFVDSE